MGVEAKLTEEVGGERALALARLAGRSEVRVSSSLMACS
jgi:hypothetical protein